MIKHTEKVIQKAEEYGQYLRTEWQKAKEAGLTQHDNNKGGEEWFWWTAHMNDFMSGECVYFAYEECLDAQFYMNEKPKLDPLSYLSSMIWGSVGEDYNGLELLDYQFVLLAIIHDAQNWQAGRKRIYFNPLEKKTLSDRLCRAVWHHLESKIDSYNFRDVKNTIKKALQKIKTGVGQEAQNEVGDSHFIKVSRDIIAGGDIIVGDKNIKKQDVHNQKKERWYQTNTFKFVVIPLIGIFAMIVMGIPAWLSLRSKTDIPKAEKNITPPNPDNYSRTPLYFRTKKRVDDFYESIRNEKLDPWLFINAGIEVRVTKYNGDVINYIGVLFTGAPRFFFWSDDFIPPFIEDAIIKVFDQTIDECRKNGLDPAIYVYEAKRILSDFIYKIYNHMADMDQKLLKQSYPESSGRRDVKREIEKMYKSLDEQYDAALLLATKGKNTN